MAVSRPGGWRAIAAVAVACACTAPASALAAPGDLDTSFGTGGTYVLHVGAGRNSFGAGVAVAPDGKVVLGGAAQNSAMNSDLMALRLRPDGTLDPAFGPGGAGYGLYDLGGYEHGNDMALSPNGSIYLAGDTQNGATQDFAVARLTTGGTLDPGFHSGTGYGLVGFGSGDEYGSSIELAAGGKILVGGQTDVNGTNDLAVARILDPQGTLDTSYGLGTGGSAADFSGGREYGGLVAQQSDGRILVAGFTYTGTPDETFAVARVLNPQGTFDPSFGPGMDGRATVNFGPLEDEPSSIAVQPDDKILLAGTTTSGDTADIAVVRLLPGGALDPSFGTGGKKTVDFAGGTEQFTQIVLQPDGKMVLVSTSRTEGGTIRLAVARLNPDGTLDTTYGTGGLVLHAVGPSPSADGAALAPDGDILAAVTLYSDSIYSASVTRIQGDPPPVLIPPPVATKVKCAGKNATIVGTAKGEKLKGTKRVDVIAGLGGSDRIFGLGGNDLICGGAGKDKLYGGKGKDRLLGQAGRDVLRGGKGRDKLAGGPGKDSQKQ